MCVRNLRVRISPVELNCECRYRVALQNQCKNFRKGGSGGCIERLNEDNVDDEDWREREREREEVMDKWEIKSAKIILFK